ncbi:unnamed protein product [Caenorhabditis sp. 36 PRJEB53466]|nr:unnamed protein product [Caenorhabditis sp. 36 PRJEB53466]
MARIHQLGQVIRVKRLRSKNHPDVGYFLNYFFYRLVRRLSKMSKTRRLFLSMQDDDDFWGNGDRFEEEKSKQRKCRLADDDEEEMEEKYFFKQSKLARQRMQEQTEEEAEGDDGDEELYRETVPGNNWNVCMEVPNDVVVKSDARKPDPLITSAVVNENAIPKQPFQVPVDSNDSFFTNYRTFFRGRPEVLNLIRNLYENGNDDFQNNFIELYEKTRKRLEMFPNPQINQILRRTTTANTNTSEQRARSRQAVVVSNFREPDRRLGRYSKYYYHHNVGPEVYSRKVFVGGLPACVTEVEILGFFSQYGRLQVDWPSKHYGSKSDSDPSLCNEVISTPPPSTQPMSHLALASPPFGQINPFMTDLSAQSDTPMGGFSRHNNGGGFQNYSGFGSGFGTTRSEGSTGEKRQQHLGYVFLLFEKERSVRDLVADCYEEEEGLFITLESSLEPIRVQIRPWLLADAEFLMDFNVPINTKLVAFIGGVPRPLKAVELAHFFEQTYGNVVCVGIDIDNKFKYPRGSGRVAFSNYDAYVQAITDRYIVLDHEDIHKRVEIKPYFFHNQSCEECSGRYHRQHAPFFCPSLECFQYYCEPCWHKMHSHPSRFHHMPVVKGV